MNVIRNVICTLIILPIGLQAETSHSSMAKDTITVVATGNQNTVFETPSMVSVVTNDTPWSQNAVTSAGMLKGVAGLSQTGAGRTNGQTFNLRGTVAKLAMRQPFVLFKGLTFQKLCLPGAFRPGDHHNKMLRPGLCVVHASPQYL